MEKENKSIGRKIWSIFTTVLVVIIVLCTIFLMGARIIGLNVYTVISGSMEPTYHVGDLIYVQKVDASEIQVGDPITFILNEDLVVATHRVVRIDAEEQHFFTKGDNNQVEDISPVHFNNLIGKPLFSIPFLGYLSEWVKSPPGLYIAIAIGIALLGIVFIPDLFMQAKRDEKKAEAEKAKKEIEAVPAELPDEPEVPEESVESEETEESEE